MGILLIAGGTWFPLHAAIRFDVFLGYDDVVPEASWFPITFEVFNDGPTFNAIVEVASTQYDRAQRRTLAVELPTGTTKRFVLPVFSSGRYSSSWDVRLLDEKGYVRAESPGLRARKVNPWYLPLFAAISRSPPILPDIKSRNSDLQPAVARILPNLFPDHPITLEGLDTIYLGSERALELKVNQVNALLAWLHAGGHLIVGIEQPLHVTGNEWLRGLLPCEVTGMSSAQTHAALQQWLVGDRLLDGTLQELRLPRQRNSARPEAPFSNPYAKLAPDETFEQAPLQIISAPLRDGQVVIGSTEQPLVVTALRGAGRITVLCFSPELEPFRSWKHRSFFWAKISSLPPELLASDQYSYYGGQSSDGIFGAMIDSKQVRKLPVGWLLLLLVGYLIVIGPLDYYWLKKINRQMLTWVTFPVYVALFSILIYFIGYKLRAGETEWNELHVVDVLPLGERADLHGRTYASLYSPVNATYRLACALPFATLRGEYMGIYGAQEGSRANVQQHGNSFAAELAVPVWTSQLYVSDWWQRNQAPLQLTVAPQADSWRVTVDNRLDKKVSPAFLVIAGQVLSLGELPPRQIKTLTVPKTETALPTFVQEYGREFLSAAGQRRQAFGKNVAFFPDLPRSAMAACFLRHLDPQTQSGDRQFITPPGLDLSLQVERGRALLLAWTPGLSPMKPVNQFSPSRSRQDTLWRLTVPVTP